MRHLIPDPAGQKRRGVHGLGSDGKSSAVVNPVEVGVHGDQPTHRVGEDARRSAGHSSPRRAGTRRPGANRPGRVRPTRPRPRPSRGPSPPRRRAEGSCGRAGRASRRNDVAPRGDPEMRTRVSPSGNRWIASEPAAPQGAGSACRPDARRPVGRGSAASPGHLQLDDPGPASGIRERVGQLAGGFRVDRKQGIAGSHRSPMRACEHQSRRTVPRARRPVWRLDRAGDCR